MSLVQSVVYVTMRHFYIFGIHSCRTPPKWASFALAHLGNRISSKAY